ncbi:MAG: penicillin-binding protein 2 [Candidatus Krumholzibacteria bacterium]|nr:penicillin-binding protein 2 [Candidatus Krumholzibacteria bacterium]
MAKRDSRELVVGKTRERVLIGLVLVFFAILAGQLFSLQAIRHDKYAQVAEENQLHRERVPGPRGFITDRSGNILVDNVLNFNVVLPWKKESEVAETVSRLSSMGIPIDSVRVLERFEAWKKKNKMLPFPIVNDADKVIISFVRENSDLFPDLRVMSQARRRYRYDKMASHLLGYVGEVGDVELSRQGEKKYYQGDLVGKTGVEQVCEKSLRGEDGVRALEVNATGRILGEIAELSVAPEIGKKVVLTLDLHLQKHLESLMTDKGAGTAVAMNVYDGSILAAVSVPGFDPNEFAAGISSELLQELFDDKTKPLFNRIQQARYPPASTHKIISTFAVLTNGLVNPGEILVYCNGSLRFGNRVFRCWRPEGHGAMNLYTGFVQSCDVYFYKVAEIMDVDVLANASKAFGLDTKTGIDLPGELPGLVPGREYYDRKLGKGKWTQGHVLNNIIGQGEYLVNTLHVLTVCAAIANGGFLVRPHIVKFTGDELPVVYAKKRVPGLSGRTLEFLRRCMEGVVQDVDGTAYWTRLDWVDSAGKTGTAQNPHGEHHAWYTAYAPADAPEIAIVVLIEHGGHGGEVAAPVVRDFFSEYFSSDLAQKDGVETGDVH